MNYLKMAIVGIFLTATTLTATAGSNTAAALNLSDPVVRIETSMGNCSGVHFEQGRVLTASHCFSDKFKTRSSLKVRIDGQEGVIKWIDRTLDVAEVLYRSGSVIPPVFPLECVTPIQRLAKVSAEGYPFSFGRTTTFGNVATVDQSAGRWKSVFVHTATAGPGMSGGPILNLWNKVIGIHVGGVSGYNFGLAIPVTHVCAKIKGEK